MQRMPQQEAFALAAELTSRVNLQIANSRGGSEVAYDSEEKSELGRALPRELMNLATLTLPWDAYRVAHGGAEFGKGQNADDPQLICSLPEEMESAMRIVLAETGIWSGTLLDTLSSLLQHAKEEIILIGPYWSVQGVDSLFRRLSRQDFHGLTFTILTQPRSDHSKDSLVGLLAFSARLTGLGANCSVRSPPSFGMRTPLLHAKAVVVDRKDAYVGSANFTGSGMDFSVELGIRIGGQLAGQLRDWLTALSRQLHPW